eukprot:SAG31_NODE_10294_length_1159_cov_0.404717_1_plen_72_part_00
MRKYQYFATAKGQEIDSSNVGDLVIMINEIYEFPIVTRDSINNYFNRPEKMKKKKVNLDLLQLRRQNLGAI